MKSQIDTWNPRPIIAAAAVAGALLLLLVADRQIVRFSGDMFNSDFFSLWASGRGLWEGIDHYDPTAWADLHVRYGSDWLENPVFIYPLPVSFLFLPFALLPLPLAATAWEFTSQVMLIVSIAALLAGLRQAGRGLFAFLVLVIFLSRPAMVVFTNGQLAALWPFSLSLFYLFARRERYAMAGGVLILLLLKPSIPILVLPVALAWLLTRRAWRGLLAFAVVGVATLGLSLAVEPGWIGQWRVFAMAKGGHFATFVPTLWGLAYDLLAVRFPGSVWLVALAAVTGALVVFCVWWLGRTTDPWPPALWLACAACLSLFVSPYAWNYDQVLLLFPLVVVVSLSNRMDRKRRLLTWAGAAVVMDVLPYVLLAVAGRRGVDTLSALIPLAMLLLLIGAAHWSAVCHDRREVRSQ